MTGRPNRRGFGYLRKLPSGRWQASYVGPDLARHGAPGTFDAKQDAEAWLGKEHTLIAAEQWTPPARRHVRADRLTFGEFAESWLLERDLKPRTRAHYRSLLDSRILPTLSPVDLIDFTPTTVRTWWAALDKGTPTMRAHAYGLLRAILATAVGDELLASNPCMVRGAGTTKRVVQIKPASLEELAKLVQAMPEKYRVLTLLAAWLGMRFGELTELRRKDIDLKNGVVHVRRAVAWVDSKPVVGKPKSDAGARDVAIPPHLLPLIKDHIAAFALWGQDGLVFPSQQGVQLTTSTLYASYWPARKKAGRPDLRWHDLRHTGAVLAASTGATLSELMTRLGHSTPGAALRYQHTAAGRDQIIAKALSKLAEGAVS